MESVTDLHKKIRRMDNQLFFYHRAVLSILNHRYVVAACPDEIAALVTEMTEQNRIVILPSDLHRTPLLELIFQPVTGVAEVSDYLIRILLELNRIITSQHGTQPAERLHSGEFALNSDTVQHNALSTERLHSGEPTLNPNRVGETEDDAVAMGALEQEFVYHYFTMVNRLKEIILESDIQLSVETYFRLLKRLTDTITIPFQGRPLSGIQLMGVLETRVLDFDRLIILSMNEGIFPAKQTAASLIPYTLRKGFGLPTYEHQDSIWAYHFYRLIARAKKVSLLYDTRTEGLQTGEVSRFVHQLRYHFGVPIKDKPVVFNISSSQPLVLQIEKTEEVMSKMNAYLTGGDKALSASTIKKYIDCPLQFYFSSVKGLKEEEEVSESVEDRVFGNIFHQVVEELYQPFCDSVVTADILQLCAKEKSVTEAIHRAFSAKFFRSGKVHSLSGQHYLTGEMIRKYVLKLIENDRRLTPFRYIRSEQRIQYPIRLTDGTEIQLKGFIDRLDEVDGIVRVVDYKTGLKKGLEIKSVDSLFDSSYEKRQPDILQIFMYAWMYSISPHSGGYGRAIQPVLYYVRDFFSNEFAPVIYHGKEKDSIVDFAVYKNEFENCMRSCLDQLFNPTIPFTQATTTKLCVFCPFAIICGR
jgi:hypothetical protein